MNGFLKDNESMNYCFEANNKSVVYDFVYNFMNVNADKLTLENINDISRFMIPPQAFDDGKYRSEQKYNQITKLIDNLVMTKKTELGKERGL